MGVREAGDDYCGEMEGVGAFSCKKPFVLMNWPEPGECKSFETEEDAREFIISVKALDPHVVYAPLSGFSSGQWSRV
jgi:hypothetical protein